MHSCLVVVDIVTPGRVDLSIFFLFPACDHSRNPVSPLGIISHIFSPADMSFVRQMIDVKHIEKQSNR